jgi:hypothetical protein
MYICPHCQQPGISALRRAYLGPAVPATCTACGGKIGIPWGKSMIAYLPMALSFFGANFLYNTTLMVLVLLAGTAATFFLHHFYVPLEAR